MYKTIAKIAAVLAILGLVLSSFALTFGAETKFERDLTVGATGADVTALQTWLISKGFTIAAGATGYFGEQTRGALARYQASVSIMPAVGYFGPITRAKVNASGPPSVPTTPLPSEDDEVDEPSEAEEAADALDDVRDALSEARDDVEEAHDDGALTSSEERLLDDAEDLIEDAEEELDDRNYDEVMDLVEEAEDLIDEALEGIAESNDDDDPHVSTSADVNDRSGADNDLATFMVAFDLSAFGDDAFVSQNPSTSIEYEIQDRDGDEVAGSTSLSAVLTSTASEQGGYFRIDEDDTERLTLTVSFDPLVADEGTFYRLAVTQVHFNETAAAPNRTWNVTPDEDFRTDYVYIAD